MVQQKQKMVSAEEEALIEQAQREAAEGKAESFAAGAPGSFNDLTGLGPPPGMPGVSAPQPDGGEGKDEEKGQQPSPPDTETLIGQLVDQLSAVSSNPPTVEEVKGWKHLHGDIFVAPMDEKQIYVYRYLKRQEWKQLLAQNSTSELGPEGVDELIFRRCLLWPKLGELQENFLGAGVVPTMSSQIQAASGWVNPQALASVTTKI